MGGHETKCFLRTWPWIIIVWLPDFVIQLILGIDAKLLFIKYMAWIMLIISLWGKICKNLWVPFWTHHPNQKGSFSISVTKQRQSKSQTNSCQNQAGVEDQANWAMQGIQNEGQKKAKHYEKQT